jgi:hypothetical protein
MRRIVLVACTKRKGSVPTKAANLYQSHLFRKSMAYATVLRPDAIYILSAKHGLLATDAVIAPYNETLKEMNHRAVKEWAADVIVKLRQVADLDADEIIILAGERYRRYLLPHLAHCKVPLAGLRIGQQLQRLSEAVGDE